MYKKHFFGDAQMARATKATAEKKNVMLLPWREESSELKTGEAVGATLGNTQLEKVEPYQKGGTPPLSEIKRVDRKAIRKSSTTKEKIELGHWQGRKNRFQQERIFRCPGDVREQANGGRAKRSPPRGIGCPGRCKQRKMRTVKFCKGRVIRRSAGGPRLGDRIEVEAQIFAGSLSRSTGVWAGQRKAASEAIRTRDRRFEGEGASKACKNPSSKLKRAAARHLAGARGPGAVFFLSRGVPPPLEIKGF